MQHRHSSNTPVWPYVIVVTCLFMLSVLAPRFWRSPHSATYNRPGKTVTLFEKWGLSGRVPQDASPHAVNPPVKSAPLRSERREIVAIGGFLAPRRVATASPTVTRHVRLDQFVPDVLAVSLPEKPPRMTPAQIAGPPLIPPGIGSIEASSSILSRKTVARMPDFSAFWPLPSALLGQLEELKADELSRPWAEAVSECLQRIRAAQSSSSNQISQHVATLGDLAGKVESIAQTAKSAELRAQLLRAGYAVERRVLIWGQVHRVVSQGMAVVTVSLTDGAAVGSQLAAVDAHLAASEHADEWRRYLLLDQLRLAARHGDVEHQRQLARRVLARLEASGLDERQKGMLHEAPFQALAMDLRRWASEPVDYLRMLDEVELYEETRSTGAARRLAACYQVIRWSTSDEVAQLAESLNNHYRNANVRVTVSAELINRLLSQPYDFEENVRDNILGARVSGTSRGSSRLRVTLLPDNRRWRMGLEAEGDIESETAATRGPATFYSQGVSRYQARKMLLLDRRGVRTERAEAEADSDIGLQACETDYDRVPILGWIARSIAIQQHDRQYPEALQETAAKLRHRASDRMDEEVQEKVAEAEREVRNKWLDPLADLQLKPVVMDMRTTSEELLLRYRLAGDVQLGAHTPRPQAPTGSLLSVQVHESALNNTLEQLKLEKKRADLRVLYRELADTFQRPDVEVPDEIPEKITVQFADRNAVRLRCDDGRVTLTLSIAELKANRRDCWRQFAVRAYYAPDMTHPDGRLVRDGVIELAGHRLGTMDQVALRTIFTKVLSRNRPLNLISKRLSDNPQLDDIRVSQFVIEDGWIGVALSKNGQAVEEHIASEDCASKRR